MKIKLFSAPRFWDLEILGFGDLGGIWRRFGVRIWRRFWDLGILGSGRTRSGVHNLFPPSREGEPIIVLKNSIKNIIVLKNDKNIDDKIDKHIDDHNNKSIDDKIDKNTDHELDIYDFMFTPCNHIFCCALTCLLLY